MDTVADVEQHNGRIRQRWGVVSDPGFLALPYVVLLHQHSLKLSSENLNVLLNILAHWHSEGRMPYPHTNTIAKRMGVSKRTVQRSISWLIANGFMEKAPKKRDERQAYDMKPLVAKLTPYAIPRVEMIQAKDFANVLTDDDLTAMNRPPASEMFKDFILTNAADGNA